MFGIESLTGSTYSAAVVGVVLVEAIALYVGYGLLIRVAGPVIRSTVGGK